MTETAGPTVDEQIGLLRQVNAWVQGQARRSRSERRWDQDNWRVVEENSDTHRCSTSFCFAGKVIELGGAEWKWTAREVADSDSGRVEYDELHLPGDEVDLVKADAARGWPEESAARRAERLLGLPSNAGLFGLFGGSNSAADIDAFVRQIVADKLRDSD